MKNGVNAVLDSGAVRGEHGALGGAPAHETGLIVGDPDCGQIAGADQLRQGERVDLIGFDFGAGDGFGAQRVADHDLMDERPEDGNDGPGVGGGFDGDGAGVGR